MCLYVTSFSRCAMSSIYLMLPSPELPQVSVTSVSRSGSQVAICYDCPQVYNVKYLSVTSVSRSASQVAICWLSPGLQCQVSVCYFCHQIYIRCLPLLPYPYLQVSVTAVTRSRNYTIPSICLLLLFPVLQWSHTSPSPVSYTHLTLPTNHRV